jgi:DnaK suppressor protein
MLTLAERSELRSIIEREIEQLEATLATYVENAESVEPDAAIGRLSRMDSLVNRGTLEIAMAESRKRLGRLRDKLGRIEEPEFGRCGGCGVWIPMERLRVAPDRGVCVQCLGRKPGTGR